MGLDLQEFRTALKITQEDAAAACGMSQAAWSRIEGGSRMPRGLAVLAIDEWARKLAEKHRLGRRRRLSWAFVTGRAPGTGGRAS